MNRCTRKWPVLTFVFLLFPSLVLAADTVRIASIYSFTGHAAPSNLLSIRGVRFAVEELNRTGGILGKPVELVELDNHSTPIGSKVAAEHALEAGVAAIVGAAWSSHSIAIARVAQASSVPMITNVSTDADVTRVGDYIFRVCFTDPFQGKVMATFARQDLRLKRAVIFKDLISDFSMGLAAEIRQCFEKLGGDVVMEVPYKHRQENFLGPVRRALAVSPDVIFMAGHDESAFLLRTARKLGLTAVPIGSDGWGAESFFQMSGSTLPLGYYCTHWTETLESAISQSFVNRYRRGDGMIHPPEALACDAVMLLADAIRRAGSVDHGDIRKALAETRDFEGVTGKITFDAWGDPLKPAVIMKIVNGEASYLKTIYPEDNADAEQPDAR